jgi:hypothetical protein
MLRGPPAATLLRVCHGRVQGAAAPAGSREAAGRIVARGHGAAPAGRPMIRGRGRCGRDRQRGRGDEPEMKK